MQTQIAIGSRDSIGHEYSCQVHKRINDSFQDTIRKIYKSVYCMQFLMLFRMTYLKIKFGLVMVEKNEIYWRHALKLRKIFTSRYSWNLFRIKNSPSCSAFDALSNGICLMIIYKTININTEVKVHIIQTLSSVETRVIFTRKIAKNRNRDVRSWFLQETYNETRAIWWWDEKISTNSLQWEMARIGEICKLVDQFLH